LSKNILKVLSDAPAIFGPGRGLAERNRQAKSQIGLAESSSPL
jgi:hypothetical protein